MEGQLLIVSFLQSHYHFIEIDEVGIELRAIDAHEAHFPVHCHSASATHACAIHHYGVE